MKEYCITLNGFAKIKASSSEQAVNKLMKALQNTPIELEIGDVLEI